MPRCGGNVMGYVWRWRQFATTPSTKWGGAYGQPQQPRASIGQKTTRADAATDKYNRTGRLDTETDREVRDMVAAENSN